MIKYYNILLKKKLGIFKGYYSKKNKIGSFLGKGSFYVLLSLILFLPVFISAQIILPNPLSVNSFPELIANALTYIAGLIGSLAVLMFVWSGILFLTSAGNENRLSQAKKVAWYAVIGLAIALSGTGLVQLVQTIING